MERKLVDRKQLRCYAFAPAPVFGPLGSLSKDFAACIECFVQKNDKVPAESFACVSEKSAVKTEGDRRAMWLGMADRLKLAAVSEQHSDELVQAVQSAAETSATLRESDRASPRDSWEGRAVLQ